MDALAAPAAAAPVLGQKVPEWNKPVLKMLRSEFGVSSKKIIDIIKETGALIAGGSLLRAIRAIDPDVHNDIDIYVPVKHMPKFLDVFTANVAYNKCNSYGASFYCNSFLRKNGIRKIYNFATEKWNNTIGYTEITRAYDIMSVRNSRNPLAVVNNFDLTFCQIWFDGTDVFASHPDDISNKKGMLQGDYNRLFCTGNPFLRRRIKKYTDRGFDISFDTSIFDSLLIDDIVKPSRHPWEGPECTNPTTSPNKFDDEAFRTRWFNRIAMRWFLNVRTDGNRLMIPLLKDSVNNQLDKLGGLDTLTKAKPRTLLRYPRIFEKSNDDGYDSEEMDDAVLKQLAITKYDEIPLAGPVLELAKPLTDDLKYYRSSTNLLLNVLTPFIFNYRGSAFKNVGEWLHIESTPREKFLKLIEIIKSKCLRVGDDSYGGDGQLFDLHSHPLEAGISQESLEGYLEGHVGDIDKDTVSCYWQPEVPVRGAPPPAGNCQHKLTLAEVKHLVSEDFWKRYSAPMPVKAGLNIIVDAYDIALSNTKTADTEGFGDLFHATMCPFCLQYEQREFGCAYMGHANPGGLGSAFHPYCQKDFLVTSMRDKYLALGRAAAGPGFDHLEWCVECGRPCWNHQHLDFAGGLVPYTMKPDPAHPGQMKIDYGVCNGGGRPELYARILAVRQVYSNLTINKPVEERQAAALAAEAAAQDPAMLARGQAIFDMEIDKRKWNDVVPLQKNYNDPAYSKPIVAEDDDFAAAVDYADAAVAPAPAPAAVAVAPAPAAVAAAAPPPIGIPPEDVNELPSPIRLPNGNINANVVANANVVPHPAVGGRRTMKKHKNSKKLRKTKCCL